MKRTCATAGTTTIWAAILISSAASADDSGPYVGAALGLVETPDNANLDTPQTPLLTGPGSDDEISWSGTLGYRFNPNIALELGYVDLGKRQAEVSDATGLTDARAGLALTAEGVTFAMIGAFPIGRWEPYLKAGVLFSRTVFQYSGTVSSAAIGGRFTNDNEDPLYGVGVRYAVSDHFQISLDLTFFDAVGEPETGQSSYFNTSAGVIWRF